MCEEKRVQCPACLGVAFVKPNRLGDAFLTCSTCGPWNGRGPKFRAWCESLPSLDSKPVPEPEKEGPTVAEQLRETESEPVPETETGDGDTQEDWLEAWGRGE
ncbi:hypothetical protein [Saccharospirillum salsuginis]|uniref:Uncharacterized protein n=1 Tax=Saccharospirillum salsuginis TaxID=418750 RepID=A0A918K6R5_9GAMM|nr:hypothetical protein [Saccharospirillum salsuginis]GGX52271.1 hypothetical protein GCM10007392_19500 [Saccharospirillum salsuginis]